MRGLFGVSHEALLLVVGGLVLVTLLALLVAGLRNPLLPRLATRNLPRRPGWAMLITLSLTLSTVILSSAFTTGDTMHLAVRSVVAGALGAADVVLFVPRPQRASGFDLMQALANGTFLTGATDYFPEAETARAREILAGDDRVAGVVPVMLEQAAVSAAGQGFQASVNVLGAPANLPDGFGPLRASDGAPLSLADLAADEVYVNREAAAALGIGPDDRLRVFGLGEEHEVRVRAVTGGVDIGGAQATLLLPLERLQTLTGRPGQINQILIANRGNPGERLDHSWPVVVALRAAYLDERAAQELWARFTTPAARESINVVAARLSGWQAEKMRRLRASLAAGGPTPEFKALAQDPDVLGSLAARWSGNTSGSGADAWMSGRMLERGLRSSNAGAAGFRALDVQRLAQGQAERWGSAFTDLFVVLGLFSLSTGVLLVVLVVSLLALERRGELGIVRALGGRRRDVILLLALEGCLYSLMAAATGLVAGAALAFGLVTLAGRLIAEYGFHLEPGLDAGSLALSFGLGFILTFVTVTTTAWRSSRFSIVNAIRDQPEPAGGPASARGLLLSSLPLLAGLSLTRLGLDHLWSLAYTGGIALTIAGLALVARWGLRWIGARGPERLVVSLAGLALVGWWHLPPEWTRVVGIPAYPRAPELSVLSGLAMLLGAVWLIAYNVGLLRHLRGDRPLWRLSAAYVAANRFRTGMTIAMFGLVILSLTLSAVLLTATSAAYGDAVAATGGWDIRADSDRPARDLRPELAVGATAPDLFRGFGVAAPFQAQAIQLDRPQSRWREVRLAVVDAGFTEAVTAELTGLTGDQRATWRELTRSPGTAIVGAGLLAESASGLRVSAAEGKDFRPFTLWVRDTRSTQPAVRLEVVGLVDSRGPFGASILTGAETLAAWPAPERASYYFAVPEGANPLELAAGIALSAPDLRAQALGQEIRLAQGVRGLLNLILQGFMGIGLVSGVAALGVISTRAVVERRRQIGVLRAVGFPARAIGLGLLLESSLVASLGAALGVGLGLVVAHGTVLALARQNPEIRFSVPWEQLSLIVLAALTASLLMTLLPAYRAARLSPAEALRDG